MHITTTFFLSRIAKQLAALTVLIILTITVSACSYSQESSANDANTNEQTSISNAYQKPGAPVRLVAETIKVAAAGDTALLQYELQVSADAEVMSVTFDATSGITLDPADITWTANQLQAGDSQQGGLSLFAYQSGFVNVLVTMHNANNLVQSRSFSVPVFVANQPLPLEKSGTVEITQEGERLISMPAEETP